VSWLLLHFLKSVSQAVTVLLGLRAEAVVANLQQTKLAQFVFLYRTMTAIGKYS
jgi:hypothetical protein